MDQYLLEWGSHLSPRTGRCAMEWVAFLAGEEHTDAPMCVSPLLRDFFTTLNDRLDSTTRQKLRPYLARTIGTRGDGLDDERYRTCFKWLRNHTVARGYLPGSREFISPYPQEWPLQAARVLSSLTGAHLDVAFQSGGLLDQLLPTEPIQIPVVEEWREVCGVAT